MKKTLGLLIIILISCGKEKSIFENQDKLLNRLRDVELLDTFANQLILATANTITEANYHPLYIGPKRDSIRLSYSSRKIRSRIIDEELYQIPKIGELEIYVDSSRIIGSGNDDIFHNGQGSKIEWEYFDNRGEIKSYPIFIENRSVDTLIVGYGEYIPIILEGEDSLGKWRPIQEHYIYNCGTGLTNFYLPPDELLITYCKQYDGDYRTKLRIVFGDGKMNYSNEFEGRINYQQFAYVNRKNQAGN